MAATPAKVPAAAMAANILAVDDDPHLLQLVDLILRKAGYTMWGATTVSEALALISRRGLPHLALVDLLMPGQNGFAFCKAIHSFSDLPCIMLTAVDNPDITTLSIEQYAEDYITKPFHPPELVARIRRVLMRIGDFSYAQGLVVPVDNCLAVDFANQQAVVAGRTVALTPTETKILHILMRKPGQTVLTDHLLRRVWPDQEVFEDSLRVHIHRLRHKIDPPKSSNCHIVTERNLGYRFVPARSG